MGVKSGGSEDYIRGEVTYGGYYLFLPGPSKVCRSRVLSKRNINNIHCTSSVVRLTLPGKQRTLMCRCKKPLGLAPAGCLSAIPVVNIKVEKSGPLDDIRVFGLGMSKTNHYIIEYAETHCCIRLSVMSWRSHHDKGPKGLPLAYIFNSLQCCTSPSEDGGIRTRHYFSVGVKIYGGHKPFVDLRKCVVHAIDIRRGMHAC
mmetsp:Transcript_5606/g.8572  ORF Transcript_5606/g.8572 Transcript_5606/m.8572 type:complete len:201 (-) Transcript_5606:416-1018(-)